MDEIDQIVEQLTDIEERLVELSMQILSTAIESGASERPPLEKKLSQARRTVARAREQLRASND